MNLARTATLFTAGLAPHCNTRERTHALQLLRENERLPPELALQIYGNNISGALGKSLAAAYPACVRILGEACFNSIAQHCIEHAPSHLPDLNAYGATFGDFLDGWTASREQFSDYLYLGDLARLEWLCHTACYAADDPPFDFATVAEAAPDTWKNLRFQLGHSVGLLQSDYPVMAIRAANLATGTAAEIQAGELPEHLVVSRPEYQPRVEQVDAAAFRILAACREGKTLGQLVTADEQLAAGITAILPGLIHSGWITGVTVNRAVAPECQ
jgi:hypothetical protein